jgi:epoxyqueuosine reductase QueG
MISVGIRLLDSIVDQLPNRENRTVAMSYRYHAYDVINQRLDHVTSRLASELQQLGYSTFPIASAKRVDDATIAGPVSHKLAARLAGLGWVGKSCLFITPQYGPRVRLATLLTEAPLVPTGQQMETQCGECQQCVAICPARAFTGRAFHPEEPREARFDASACETYINSLGDAPEQRVCGLCLYVCPHGRKKA